LDWEGEEIDEEEEDILGPPIQDEVDPDLMDRETLDVVRSAIDRGLVVGKALVSDGIGYELARNGYDFDYVGGESMVLIPEDAMTDCPFVENWANRESSATSCRLVVEQARDHAYLGEADVSVEAELGSEFNENRAVNEHWFENGLTSGIDGEFIMAIRRLREARVCDQEPTPIQSSFEQGIAVGRDMFAGVLEEQVESTPITVCDIDGGIVAPARDRAREMVAETFETQELCAGYDPTEMEARAAFHQAENEYRRGIAEGVEEGAVIGSEQLFRTWRCQPPRGDAGGGGGDPLIIDLDGDGVRTSRPAQGVMFEIAGQITRTGWMADPDDGLLAIDHNDNGRIDGSGEIFGDRSWTPDGLPEANGLLTLARYDRIDLGGNGDGVIDERDLVHGALVVWRDANLDGLTDANELVSLGDAGVSSINLDYFQEDDTLITSFERTDGSTGQAVDVWLSYL